MNRIEHIATIDFCYWRIGKLNELISKPKSNIERLVDNACGYNEEEEVNKADKLSVYNNCTFNFQESNSAQNQLERIMEEIKSVQPVVDMYSRQLMTIYQMRSDMDTDKGNKAVIDAISSKKLAVVFETDELKERILHSDSNPTKKAFLVDVVLQTVNGKTVAYKVMALHDVIDLE